MIRGTANVLDASVTQPFGQVASDIAGTVVGQEPGEMDPENETVG
jgi:hypothetical protein